MDCPLNHASFHLGLLNLFYCCDYYPYAGLVHYWVQSHRKRSLLILCQQPSPCPCHYLQVPLIWDKYVVNILLTGFGGVVVHKFRYSMVPITSFTDHHPSYFSDDQRQRNTVNRMIMNDAVIILIAVHQEKLNFYVGMTIMITNYPLEIQFSTAMA